MIILTIIQAVILAFWVVLSSLIAGLLALLPFTKKWAQAYPSKVWGPGVLLILGVKVQILGKENMEKFPSKIYIGNHQSLLDIPVLFRSMPVNLFFVAKKELRKVPFMGWAMEKVGMIFIDRSDREKAMQSMHEAGEAIRSGRDVVSFPEGTRSKTGEIGPFKRGSFIIAKQGNIPIVPVAMYGALNILKPGSKVLRPGKVIVHVGKTIHPEQFKNMSTEELAEYVRNEVLKLKQSITPNA